MPLKLRIGGSMSLPRSPSEQSLQEFEGKSINSVIRDMNEDLIELLKKESERLIQENAALQRKLDKLQNETTLLIQQNKLEKDNLEWKIQNLLQKLSLEKAQYDELLNTVKNLLAKEEELISSRELFLSCEAKIENLKKIAPFTELQEQIHSLLKKQEEQQQQITSHATEQHQQLETLRLNMSGELQQVRNEADEKLSKVLGSDAFKELVTNIEQTIWLRFESHTANIDSEIKKLQAQQDKLRPEHEKIYYEYELKKQKFLQVKSILENPAINRFYKVFFKVFSSLQCAPLVLISELVKHDDRLINTLAKGLNVGTSFLMGLLGPVGSGLGSGLGLVFEEGINKAKGNVQSKKAESVSDAMSDPLLTPFEIAELLARTVTLQYKAHLEKESFDEEKQEKLATNAARFLHHYLKHLRGEALQSFRDLPTGEKIKLLVELLVSAQVIEKELEISDGEMLELNSMMQHSPRPVLEKIREFTYTDTLRKQTEAAKQNTLRFSSTRKTPTIDEIFNIEQPKKRERTQSKSRVKESQMSHLEGTVKQQAGKIKTLEDTVKSLEEKQERSGELINRLFQQLQEKPIHNQIVEKKEETKISTSPNKDKVGFGLFHRKRSSSIVINKGNQEVNDHNNKRVINKRHSMILPTTKSSP